MSRSLASSGEPTEDEVSEEAPNPLPNEEDEEQEEENVDIKKRSTEKKQLHYDYEREDLGTGIKGAETYERKDEQVALKKPALPFYCSIPLVSSKSSVLYSLFSVSKQFVAMLLDT